MRDLVKVLKVLDVREIDYRDVLEAAGLEREVPLKKFKRQYFDLKEEAKFVEAAKDFVESEISDYLVDKRRRLLQGNMVAERLNIHPSVLLRIERGERTSVVVEQHYIDLVTRMVRFLDDPQDSINNPSDTVEGILKQVASNRVTYSEISRYMPGRFSQSKMTRVTLGLEDEKTEQLFVEACKQAIEKRKSWGKSVDEVHNRRNTDEN